MDIIRGFFSVLLSRIESFILAILFGREEIATQIPPYTVMRFPYKVFPITEFFLLFILFQVLFISPSAVSL